MEKINTNFLQKYFDTDFTPSYFQGKSAKF